VIGEEGLSDENGKAGDYFVMSGEDEGIDVERRSRKGAEIEKPEEKMNGRSSVEWDDGMKESENGIKPGENVNSFECEFSGDGKEGCEDVKGLDPSNSGE
jgi:hypothetical protein